MSEEQLKASQEEITSDTQAELSDEELEAAGGGGMLPLFGGTLDVYKSDINKLRLDP